ncbi:hypothetical protein [Paraglaciecola arctica]|uniref:Beta-ketoacyl synthase N-terminal domain-containing protein n=1 Tax=Paraglaciecola arctica BSs20135 TaxID=493475 RepID=K6X8Y5_9ALTE|nr:hypothetical protein [Paraglaciecola arctica]GAC17094.1 hypothetical protein GARC_0112 [Paraglaciecola arctica BSs20135]
MKMTLFNYAYFSHSRALDNKSLRQQVKQKYALGVRRLDNFTLCALAAVAELGTEIQAYKKLSLISCAQYFSIELIQQMLLDLKQNRAIRPLDFVATVGNAANFYIAKEFSIDGSNLFIGADEDALTKSLLLSSLELNADKEAAVILLIWQETEQERFCHALLLGDTQEQHNKYAYQPNLKYIDELSTMDLPVVLEVNL